jgi:two-component system, OmpR family, sensor histidine kinase KdpD
MTEADLRPDPDALLASLHEEESRARRGTLKVFLGMCPGVGKTYSMLQEAQRERADGVNVLVGIVETHGRVETEAVLDGLEVLPRRKTEHRGVMLDEMDLEGLLARHPKLAVVDELAHTNAPGSRHAKRWQDVVELLEAGIDVISTLNIQHVESRSDAVRQITGAPVHETVPDSLIDIAGEVELVDITAQALRDRLSEGKVYKAGRSAVASDNFFQESNLNALREMALRFTAERVDRQLRAMRKGVVKSTVWRSGERLLVAVGPSPFSTQLVRWTCRLAAAQGAPWVAVHVASSAPLKPQAQALLDRNLTLARELGAQVVMTQGDDIAAALVRSALEYNATQIVVGKPRGNRWIEFFKGGNMVERLIRLGGNIDIYVVPAEAGVKRSSWVDFEPTPKSELREYGMAAATVFAITVGTVLFPSRYYLAAGLVYLLGIIFLSLKVGRWPILLAGVLSALTWNFLFIPPRFTFHINALEDATLFVTYFVVAVVAGQLTARVRLQALDEHNRERRATALFKLTHALSEARGMDAALSGALRLIDDLFSARSAVVLFERGEKEPHAHFASTFAPDERERGVAHWVCINRRAAGRFTDTLPSSAGYYIPMICEDHCLGALGIAVDADATLTLQQRDLLEAFARQIAFVIEREHLRAASERERLLAESEKLHHALLDCVSHELRTPLAVITGNLDYLAGATDEHLRAELLGESRTAVRRLNRLVGNLLGQTRLESGALRPKLDWCDMGDIVNAVVENVRDAVDGHPLDVMLPDDLPPIRADHTLTEQALANLLLNAAQHTPEGTPICIGAGIDHDGKRAFFSVSDKGPGIPDDQKARIFQKFSRGDAARAGGLGLGLSIVRGFVAAQGGEVAAGDNPGGGAIFTIYLPYVKATSEPRGDND